MPISIKTGKYIRHGLGESNLYKTVFRITGATLGALGITAEGVLICEHSSMSDRDQVHHVTTQSWML